MAVLSLYLLLGMLAGLIGVAYNRSLLAALTALGRLRRCLWKRVPQESERLSDWSPGSAPVWSVVAIL